MKKHLNVIMTETEIQIKTMILIRTRTRTMLRIRTESQYFVRHRLHQILRLKSHFHLLFLPRCSLISVALFTNWQRSWLMTRCLPPYLHLTGTLPQSFHFQSNSPPLTKKTQRLRLYPHHLVWLYSNTRFEPRATSLYSFDFLLEF